MNWFTLQNRFGYRIYCTDSSIVRQMLKDIDDAFSRYQFL